MAHLFASITKIKYCGKQKSVLRSILRFVLNLSLYKNMSQKIIQLSTSTVLYLTKITLDFYTNIQYLFMNLVLLYRTRTRMMSYRFIA